MPVSPIVTRIIDVVSQKIGMAETAKRIHATEPLLEAWRDGFATIPRPKFLQLVDLLMELDVGWDDWNGPVNS